MDVHIKTESEESENENETNDVTHDTKDIGGPFLCEFCECGIQTKRFQYREELITHTLKHHPNVCLGCFEMFGNAEVLLEHLKTSFHESMVCRACCRDFRSRLAMLLHYCQNVPNSPPKDLKFDSSAPRKIVNETFEMVEKRSVKNKPLDTVDESGEDSFSSESEDDIEEKCVREDDSEDDSSVSSDDDNKDSFRMSGVKDVVLDCMHCSFVVQGTQSIPSIYGLRVHIFIDHPNACGFCYEAFDTAEDLVEHQESMKHKIWGCVPCKCVFMKISVYQLHMVKKHPDQCKFQCPECPARFFSTNQIPKHVRTYHRNVTKSKIKLIPRNICGLCDYSTSSTFAHIMHMIEMHSESNQMPIFNCNVCQFGFNRPHDFSKHIVDKHFEDSEFQNVFKELSDIYTLRFECEPCVKTFVNRSKYLHHLRIVHPSSMAHQCSFCGWRFLDPNDLRLHESADHTKDLPYACDECQHSFIYFDKFLQHLKKAHRRTPLPTFIYCFAHKKKLFCYRDAVRHFQNMHESKRKTKVFQCEQCGKVLSSQFCLDLHILNHQPDRPFKCETCGKRYSSSFRLNSHKVTHQPKFDCETCGKAFHSERNLKRHIIVHTGEKPFECSICGLRVSQDSALKRHMNKVHPGGIMGKPLSTKPRKCRVLEKTLMCEKNNATVVMKDGKIDAMFPKTSDKQTSQPQTDSHPTRKRQPTAASSESGSVRPRRNVESPEHSLAMASGKAKRQTTTAPLRRRRKGRKSRKSFQSSSSGEDEKDFWESSSDDEVYVPQTKFLATDSGDRRRSLRLKKL